jgi:hypothetical protein
MTESRVSVGASLAFSWNLWVGRWRSIWGVLALTSLAATVYLTGDFAGQIKVEVVGMAAYLVVVLMTNGAVYRLAFAGRHGDDPAFTPGPIGVQWRAMEWRLLGASLLLALFFAILIAVAFVAVAGVAMGVAMNKGEVAALTTPQALIAALGPQGEMAVTILAAIAYVALIYVAVRLSLALAATADGGRIAVLKTWKLTKGQVWRILVSMLMIQLPVLFVSVIVAALARAGASGGMGLATEAMAPAGALSAGLVMGVLTGGVAAPLGAGVLAYYYMMSSKAP